MQTQCFFLYMIEIENLFLIFLKLKKSASENEGPEYKDFEAVEYQREISSETFFFSTIVIIKQRSEN